MRKIQYLMLFFMLMWAIPDGVAQKMLLLENARKVRPQKFFIGQKLTYQLHEPSPTWLTAEIADILPAEKALVLGIQCVAIADIEALRFRRPMFDGLGKQLAWLGVQTTFFASVGLLFYDSSNRQAKHVMLAGATTAVSSVLLSRLLKYKNVRLGKQYRLRAIEIPH